MKTVALLLLAGLALACDGVCAEQTVERTYSFVEFNAAGQQVRVLELALTNQKGSSCLGGEWKRVRVVSDPDKYTKAPVYLLTNGKLEVLLINGLCDSYDSYIGETSNGVFAGEHVQYGWSAKAIGKVRGTSSEE